MIPGDLIGSVRALPPDEAIAAIRRRLDEGGEAGDLATSDVRALLAAHDDLARLRAPADLAAIEARADEVRAADDALALILSDECTTSTMADESDALSRRDDAVRASAADVPALLAHIAATRERHAAEVAAARAEALREAEDACETVLDRFVGRGEDYEGERHAVRECRAAVAALATKGAPDV